MIRILKRIYYSVSALVLVYLVYFMSLVLFRVGLNNASKDFFFMAVGLYLVIPLFKLIKDNKNIPKDALVTNKIKKELLQIEEDDISKIQGVTLKYNNYKEYIDCIIINKYGLYNIVFCDYKGNIIINKNGEWIEQTIKGTKGVISPIEKIKKNRKVLAKALKEEEIIDLVVMTNAYVEINQEEASTVPIVRYDELADYINEYNSEEKFDEEELYDRIYPLIYKEKDLSKETDLFERYLDNRWQYRSRFAVISFFILFYIFKTNKII